MTELIADICTGFCQETVLTAAILIYMILAFIFGKNFFKISKAVAVISVLGTLISSLKIQIIPTYYAFKGAYVSNFYTVFFKILILLSVLVIILISKNTVLRKKSKIFDYFVMILFSTLGAITLVCSNDFITMFISLELMSLSTLVLMLFSKGLDARKTVFNRFLIQNAACAIILLGISYIYFSSGSLNFDVIYSLLNSENELSPFFSIGCILCALGMTFYLGIIPFSNYVPELFEKIKNNTCLFVSVIPVIAVFGILSRLIVFLFQYTPMVQALLFIIGILSIYKGFLGLLRQENLKSFMGYSLCAQSGFILLGLCLANPYAVSTSVFGLLSFIIETAGMWICINLLCEQENKKTITDLKGLIYRNRPFALCILIFLFSLAGLPLTSGFLAKIYIFGAIAGCTNLYLAFLGLIMLAAITGIYAYMKPVRKIFETCTPNNFINIKFSLQKLILLMSAILIVTICIVPDKIIQICQFAAYQL